MAATATSNSTSASSFFGSFFDDFSLLPPDWEPRHSFLSVHPKEMLQAFVNLVDPRQAKKKLENLFMGNNGQDGVVFFAVAVVFFTLLRLYTRRVRNKIASGLEAEGVKKE
ncbi:unnamed protein product [Amoebophrya sp. A120]|nr:unnamed protein product [Amoebophrya sp. A120]|eukprot:GSA120T00020941001.1